MLESFRDQLCANAAIAAALQAATLHPHDHGSAGSDDVYGSGPEHAEEVEDDDGGDDTNRRKRKHDTNAAAVSTKGRGAGAAGARSSGSRKDSICRNQTGYIGVRQRKWGMFAAEIRDGDKRRWLGSFGTGRDAGMAYDAAAISQKGSKAKTNFRYEDFASLPRQPCETVESVRWDLLPKDIAERFPVPSNPSGNGAREEFDSAPSSRAGPGAAAAAAAAAASGRASGRGIDQHTSDADGHVLVHAHLHHHADGLEQPSKRSRSGSFGPPPEHATETARHSAATYPFEVHGSYGDEGHLPPPGYYTFPSGAYLRHPADEQDDPEDYPPAPYHPHHHYHTAGQHPGAQSSYHQLLPAYREPSGGSSQPSSSTLGGNARGSPRGGAQGLPPGACARMVATAVSRATAAAAYEEKLAEQYMHAPYPMQYLPKGYRPASGRGCGGSDGGMRPDYPPAYMGRGSCAGGRPHSDSDRSCDGAGAGGGVTGAGPGRRTRPSEDSLPLGSLGLDGAEGVDAEAFSDVEAHPMMMHYLDPLGPYPGGYEHVGMLGGAGHPPDQEACTRGGGRLGDDVLCTEYMLPGPEGMVGHGYLPGVPGYRYLDPHGYEMEAGEAEEAMEAAGWHHGGGHYHGHGQLIPMHAEEEEALASLQQLDEPLAAPLPQSSSMDRRHVLEGAHAIVAAAAAAAQGIQEQEEGLGAAAAAACEPDPDMTLT